jgi:hypothetical protein
MDEDHERTPLKRHYPPVYEKIIPIALTVIVVAIIVLLIIILSVFVGLFPGAG